jgi:hypothetical protein
VLIATTPFRSTLEETRRLGGLPGVRWAEVAHPLQSLDSAATRRRAEEVVAQFADIVVAPAPPRLGGRRSPQSAPRNGAPKAKMPPSAPTSQ